MVIHRLVGTLLAVLLLGACAAGAPPTGPAPELGSLHVTLVAGPVCPVERNPPDPACAPRPVADREILLLAADGTEVARQASAADGTLTFAVPAAAYTVRAAPYDGFPTGPADETATVETGRTTELTLSFDTGIR